MKFHVWSDLHTELLSTNHVKKLCKMHFKKDLYSSIILAGDNGKPGDRRYLYVLDWCSRRYKNVFIVAGNHEYYNTDENVVENLRTMCKRFTNIYFLDKNVYCADDYIILGCTLWTCINTFELEYIKKYYNDYNCIKDFDNMGEWHKADLNWLTNTLEYYKNDARKKIVITHHMPSHSLIDSKYKNSPINSAFATSDCDELFSLANYWIYGHTHTSRRSKINGCTCICNPIGYRGENHYIPNFSFNI